MLLIKKTVNSVNTIIMIITPGPIPVGVILNAIFGFRTYEITLSAELRMLLSRKDPNDNNGSLQNEMRALPGTLPNQSESSVKVGVPRIKVLKNQAAKKVKTNRPLRRCPLSFHMEEPVRRSILVFASHS